MRGFWPLAVDSLRHKTPTEPHGGRITEQGSEADMCAPSLGPILGSTGIRSRLTNDFGALIEPAELRINNMLK